MRSLFAFLLTTLFCNVVQADFALRWSPLTSTSGGSPISVDLFLDETLPDTNLATYGASGVSYKVNLTGVGSLQTPVGNPNFDLVTTSGSGASVTVEQTSILGLTSTAGGLKIGSFTIDPTIAGNGTLKVALFGSGADFGIYDSTFVTQINDGVLIPAPDFNYSFTAVPEPDSLVACMSVGAIVALRRLRRENA
jgi:hypothetical protein